MRIQTTCRETPSRSAILSSTLTYSYWELCAFGIMVISLFTSKLFSSHLNLQILTCMKGSQNFQNIHSYYWTCWRKTSEFLLSYCGCLNVNGKVPKAKRRGKGKKSFGKKKGKIKISSCASHNKCQVTNIRQTTCIILIIP